MKPTTKMIFETATEPGRNWTNKSIALFHAFNPNGIVAQKKLRDAAISKLVDDGVVPSGWIIAYGTFNNYATGELIRVSGLPAVSVKEIKVRVLINMISRSIATADEKLAGLGVEV
jgi:hypothetical protein